MRSETTRKLIRSGQEIRSRPADKIGSGPGHQPSEEAATPSDSASINEQHDRELKRIIVIDDDDLILDLVRRILESEYEVLTATSGSEGLDIIRSTPVDLVLLDWMMPGMDGLSVLISLKADESTQAIPVVFLSGKTEQQAIDQALESGAEDYITKPFKQQDLVRRIGASLEVG